MNAGFFLPLAGTSTIKEINDNPIDVRATGRLNKLYVQLFDVLSSGPLNPQCTCGIAGAVSRVVEALHFS